jgi:protein involved in polysaccharide export with SLBB domain
MNFVYKSVFIFITLWLCLYLNCSIIHPVVSKKSVNSDLTTSGVQPKENYNQSTVEKIEKKRFIDLAHYQSDSTIQPAISPQIRSELLMPGDQLEITLYEKLPVSQEKRIEIKRIDDNGSIFIYPLGNLKIAYLTLLQARELIEQNMKPFIITPFCEITLIKKEYEPHVFVFGEAMKLGSFPIKSGDRLLDVLSLAGGTTQDAFTSSIKLVRLNGDSVIVMSVDLGSIVKHGHLERNLIMQDQDIIYIPKNMIYSITDVLAKLGSVLPWYYFSKNF